MATVAIPECAEPRSVGDLLAELGDIPPHRVLLNPWPGTATEEDLIRLLDGPRKVVCELVDGVLVEKAMGFKEGLLASVICRFLWDFAERNDSGVVVGADGPVRLRLKLVRVPDVCYVSWTRIGADEIADDSISKVIPELAVEVLSKSNTRREIDRKIGEYFTAGVLLVWVIDPQKETATIYRSPTRKKLLDKNGVLDGGLVLPGFQLPLKELFARARKRNR
jgi:Uma2 family endonuclease